MSSETPIDLKPCPFCGTSGPVLYHDTYSDYRRDWRWFVECHLCNGKGPEAEKREDAAEAWNRRAEAQPTHALEAEHSVRPILEVKDKHN